MDKPSLNLRVRARLAAEICDGLSHLHARGVVHRDIKVREPLLACARANNLSGLWRWKVGGLLPVRASQRHTKTSPSPPCPPPPPLSRWTTFSSYLVHSAHTHGWLTSDARRRWTATGVRAPGEPSRTRQRWARSKVIASVAWGPPWTCGLLGAPYCRPYYPPNSVATQTPHGALMQCQCWLHALIPPPSPAPRRSSCLCTCPVWQQVQVLSSRSGRIEISPTQLPCLLLPLLFFIVVVVVVVLGKRKWYTLKFGF